MAEVLTNIQEPGFFSQVQVSPELFLNPNSLSVVAVLGYGKVTKSTFDSIVRETDNEVDLLTAGKPSIVSLTRAYPVGSTISYGASASKVATVGSVAVNVTGLATKTINYSIGGVAGVFTFGIADPADLAAAIVEINVSTEIKASAFGTKIALRSATTGVVTIEDGTANSLLGFAVDGGESGNGIWWDPTATVGIPADTDAYSVEYESAKVADDYKPTYYSNASSVYSVYGSPAVAGNTLSQGVYGAGKGGASLFLCCQLDVDMSLTGDDLKNAKSGAITAALAALELYDIDVILPMDPVNDDPTKAALYLTHVSKMSSKLERKERIAVLAVDETVTSMGVYTDWPTLMNTFDVPAASGLEPKRIIMVAPGISKVTIDSVALTLDGTYTAAVLAGTILSSAYDEATPMTRKVLATLTPITAFGLTELSRPDKNALTSIGVTVTETLGGDGALVIVRRAMTTDKSNIASQEPSIVRAFDRVSRELRDGLENRYVGTKILPGSTAPSISAATKTFLDRLVNLNIIGGYRNVAAVQNVLEPRQFDISFEAIPIYPFLWGFIDLSIVLS
jgi:hypothetical protein